MSTHLKIIAMELLSNREVDIYFLFQRYRLTPHQTINALNILEKAGAAKIRGRKIIREKDGLRILYRNRFAFFANTEWKRVPEYWVNHENSDGTYIPNYKLIDKTMLQLIEPSDKSQSS